MKTLEFKLSLTKSQKNTIADWQKELTWVWNFGLELLLEFHQVKFYDHLEKIAKNQGVNLAGYERRWVNLSRRSAWVGTGQICSFNKNTDKYYDCNPVRIRTPRLLGDNAMSLSSYLSVKRCNLVRESLNLPPLCVPSKFIQGTLAKLADAWAAYKDPKLKNRHRPKFKKESEPIETLYVKQPEEIKLSFEQGKPDKISLPGKLKIGDLKIVNQGFKKRLHKLSHSQPRTAQIKIYPSGYYLCLGFATDREVELSQLKSKLKRSRKKVSQEQIEELQDQISESSRSVQSEFYLPQSQKIVGIDPGVANAISLDSGKCVLPNAKIDVYLKRIKRLQRKANRQQKGSKGQKKDLSAIARNHEKVRRSRNAFNHKVSTKLVREYGTIAFEDTQIENMVKRPKPQKREDGKGWKPNKAKAKAGLNRSLLKIGIGDLRTKTEQKAKVAGREFFRSAAANSSCRCSVCDCVDAANRQNQSKFECVVCGFTLHADTNAARNHLLAAKTKLDGVYRAWAWELKREETVSSPSTGTTGDSATVSQCGAPPEELNSLIGEHPIQPPIAKSPSAQSANRRIAKKQTPKKRHQTLARQALAPDRGKPPPRAVPEMPVLPGLEQFLTNLESPKKLRKPPKRPDLAPVDFEMQLEIPFEKRSGETSI
ncbi:RNA-guided endonuclease TnpB family protein [Kamptonema cortianum]|nr:RNA-guided endonuclease TnpB family protein [Kamptonema cortianum]